MLVYTRQGIWKAARVVTRTAPPAASQHARFDITPGFLIREDIIVRQGGLTALVLRWLFDVIDYVHLHLGLLRFHL